MTCVRVVCVCVRVRVLRVSVCARIFTVNKLLLLSYGLVSPNHRTCLSSHY